MPHLKDKMEALRDLEGQAENLIGAGYSSNPQAVHTQVSSLACKKLCPGGIQVMLLTSITETLYLLEVVYFTVEVLFKEYFIE